jgi:hypothetical protein
MLPDALKGQSDVSSDNLCDMHLWCFHPGLLAPIPAGSVSRITGVDTPTHRRVNHGIPHVRRANQELTFSLAAWTANDPRKHAIASSEERLVT